MKKMKINKKNKEETEFHFHSLLNTFKMNAELNLRQVDRTIEDLEFFEKKIMVCGRGSPNHPIFYPRFSTPTTNLDSEVYVSVDHHNYLKELIRRKGNYALSIIVDPYVSKKISNIGGKIYWFSVENFENKIPKLLAGIFPNLNSGLAEISLASYLGAEFVLLSGIKLSGKYKIYRDGMRILNDYLVKHDTAIFSLDGILAKKISFNDWLNILK